MFYSNPITHRSYTLARTALASALMLSAVAMFVTAVVSAPTPSSPAQTLYQYNSQPGDYIGGGISNSYTPANATIGLSGSANSVFFYVNTAIESWSIPLTAPVGEQLHPGTYYNAEGAFQTGRAPGLYVSGDGRGCDQIYGTFAINQIATDVSGNVTLLDATFTQQCESDTAPLLQGIVKFNALPLSYSFVSDPGDYIGQGVTKSYQGATSLFSLNGGDTFLQYDVSGQRDYWTALIAPPTGQHLRVHSYKTKRSPDKTNAGLDVFGDGRGCNTSTGTLNITAITFDAQGNVTSLSATFDQHCEGQTPALHGIIHHYQ
jgi:hypothetical protein